MKESIHDQMLADALYKLFKIFAKGIDKKTAHTGIGVPQENPLSTLLANIYLNKLDHFIGRLKKIIDKSSLYENQPTKEWEQAI